jgi:GNAT superfamily N-acetyltransferase
VAADVQVLRARSATDELRGLWEDALKRLKSHRGGPELYKTIRRDDDDDALLDHVVASGALWTIGDETKLLGFALVRDEVVEGVFVDHDHRRHHVATALLQALVVGEDPPKDGFALPGDRGMKSLYESMGWKARLLTMRGE